eukprot:337652-Prorocentrum_lima.AAC.1
MFLHGTSFRHLRPAADAAGLPSGKDRLPGDDEGTGLRQEARLVLVLVLPLSRGFPRRRGPRGSLGLSR